MHGIVAEIIHERLRQDAKWGEQDHDDGRWGLILAEEVGEVADAALENRPAALRAELIQVAAVAVNWVEAIDRR